MISFFKGGTPKTTRQLMNETSDITLKRASRVRIISQREQFIVKKERLGKRILSFFTGRPVRTLYAMMQFKTRTSQDGKPDTEYDVLFLVPASSGRKLTDLPVKVFCSCDDSRYRRVYTLNKSNNFFKNKDIESEYAVSISTPITQIEGSPGLCKHQTAVLAKISNK